jgi:hypothetical protein
LIPVPCNHCSPHFFIWIIMVSLKVMLQLYHKMKFTRWEIPWDAIPKVRNPGCKENATQQWKSAVQWLANELTKENRCIANGKISIMLVISKERLGHTNKFLGYRKICVRWVPQMHTSEKKAEVPKS